MEESNVKMAALVSPQPAMVVVMDEGAREPRIMSWNEMAVGRHLLYAAPVQVAPASDPLHDDAQALRLLVMSRIELDFGGVSERVPASVSAGIAKTFHRPHSWVTVEYVPHEMWTSGFESDAKFADYKMKEPGMVRGLEAAVRKAIVGMAAKLSDGGAA